MSASPIRTTIAAFPQPRACEQNSRHDPRLTTPVCPRERLFVPEQRPATKDPSIVFALPPPAALLPPPSGCSSRFSPRVGWWQARANSQPAEATEHPAARLSAGSANAEEGSVSSLVPSELPRESARPAGASARAKDRSEWVLLEFSLGNDQLNLPPRGLGNGTSDGSERKDIGCFAFHTQWYQW